MGAEIEELAAMVLANAEDIQPGAIGDDDFLDEVRHAIRRRR